MTSKSPTPANPKLSDKALGWIIMTPIAAIIGVVIALMSGNGPDISSYPNCSDWAGSLGIDPGAKCVEDGHLINWTDSRTDQMQDPYFNQNHQ